MSAKPGRSLQEKQSAYHEAVHAVAGHLFGQRCLHVIIRTGGGYGTCVFADPTNVHQRLCEGDVDALAWSKRKIIVLAAGAESERTLRRVSIVSGDQYDLAAIRNLLAEMLPIPAMDATSEAWTEWKRGQAERPRRISRKAKKIITASVNRAAIESWAARLLETHVVRGEKAMTIIENALATAGPS